MISNLDKLSINMLFLFIFSIIARAGGGGSSGDGDGSIFAIPFFIIAIIYLYIRRKIRIRKTKLALKKAEEFDSTWNIKFLENRVTEVFMAFQQDWSDNNYQPMKRYLTPNYFAHISLMLEAMQQMNRQNLLSDIKLKKLTFFKVHDNLNNELDKFDVEVQAKINDKIIDRNSNKILFNDKSSFVELWHFEKENGQWCLDGISQINLLDGGSLPKKNYDNSYKRLAISHNLFYNADFGWLLMPSQGILFSKSHFGLSDINHHMLTKFQNTVIQLFQYIPIKEKKRNRLRRLIFLILGRNISLAYTVAYTKLPKNYGNIFIEHKNVANKIKKTPKNMKRITVEWQEFNNNYHIFASDLDKANSLELLNPRFMEILVDTNSNLGIEIIGNDLYIFSENKQVSYLIMLDILKLIYIEMKM